MTLWKNAEVKGSVFVGLRASDIRHQFGWIEAFCQWSCFAVLKPLRVEKGMRGENPRAEAAGQVGEGQSRQGHRGGWQRDSEGS